MGIHDDKHVFTEFEAWDGKTLKYHVDGAGPYLEVCGKRNIPETNMYMSLWICDRFPPGNPTCKLHSHDVEQFALYIGEPDTFEVIYNIVPPDVKVDNEWMAPLEYQYRLRRTGGFYIPAGYKHNVFFVRITKFPIYEIGIMGKAEYDK